MEIVKTTAGWHDLRKDPADTPAEERKYLCALTPEEGEIYYEVLDYCEGWNTIRTLTGAIYRNAEIHNVVAWQTIEPFK